MVFERKMSCKFFKICRRFKRIWITLDSLRYWDGYYVELLLQRVWYAQDGQHTIARNLLWEPPSHHFCTWFVLASLSWQLPLYLLVWMMHAFQWMVAVLLACVYHGCSQLGGLWRSFWDSFQKLGASTRFTNMPKGFNESKWRQKMSLFRLLYSWHSM